MDNQVKLAEPDMIHNEEQLYTNTKNTLKQFIKVNTFLGFATGLVGATTLFAVPMVEDTTKKAILGVTGTIATVASAATIAVSFNKIDGYIENHDDATSLRILGQFLRAKGEDAKDELTDKMINELHEKCTN